VRYLTFQVSLIEMGSEQVAGVLRASGSRVRLVVARAADPAGAIQTSAAPLVPARYTSFHFQILSVE
jgi:hypothetical protein